jgi:hypothetical protein
MLNGIGVETSVALDRVTKMPTTRLVAVTGVGQRGRITSSMYFSTGTAC